MLFIKVRVKKKKSPIRQPKWTHIVNKELHTPPKNKTPKIMNMQAIC